MKVRKPRSFAELTKDPRVSSWSDERGQGHVCNDGVWLYLARPWWCPDTDMDIVHEYTVRDAIESLSRCYQDSERWNQSYGLN